MSSQVAARPAVIDVAAVQTALRSDGLDGWLLYDFRGLNPIAADITAVHRQGGHLATRRWYYLIPASGEPRGLVHAIEKHSLAQRQPFQFLIPLGTRGEDDDRHLTERAENRQQFESVVIGQREIEDDQIGRRRPRRLDRAGSIGRDIHVIALCLEIVSKHQSQCRVVFNYQDPMGHCRQHTGS